MIRNQGINTEDLEEDREWIQNHRANFNAFYQSILNKQYSTQLEGELLNDYEREKEMKEELDSVYKPFIQEVDGQQQCSFCSKIFDSNENIHKHLNQKHYEKIEKGMKVILMDFLFVFICRSTWKMHSTMCTKEIKRKPFPLLSIPKDRIIIIKP